MKTSNMDIYNILFNGLNPRCIAFVGGGGKTTTIKNLAYELVSKGATVVITTTTKMQVPENKAVLGGTAIDVEIVLRTNNPAYAGVPYNLEKMVGISREDQKKLLEIADYVLIEADGARRFPLKMTANYEPVIPEQADFVVAVTGLDCVGGKLKDVCHRSELAKDVLGKALDEKVEPSDVAGLIKHCYIKKPTAQKETAGFVVLLNKADDDGRKAYAKQIAEYLPEVRCVELSQLQTKN